jgi:transcription elongation factor Elf1
MPVDQNYEEEDDKEAVKESSARLFSDFDCPDCSANNPTGDDFGDGDEVLCNYCGCEFQVVVSDAGRLKLRPL